jgi:hypothetical protein
MESKPSVFPMSDPHYILSQMSSAVGSQPDKLSGLEASWAAADMGGELSGFVGYEAFQAGLSQAGFELNEQPLITLMRHFHVAHANVEAVDYKALLHAIVS